MLTGSEEGGKKVRTGIFIGWVLEGEAVQSFSSQRWRGVKASRGDVGFGIAAGRGTELGTVFPN